MHIERVKYKDIEKIPHLAINKEFKLDFTGTAPAPFIGRVGYPKVNIGILSPQFLGDTSYYDSPKFWSKGNFSVGSVATLRYGLVNSRAQANVKDLQGKIFETVQEVGIARRPAELEIKLERKPELSLKPEHDIAPFGPQAQVVKAQITANVKIDQQMEKVVRDTDLKANEGIMALYKKGFEEATLNKALSVGALGLGKNRKLVPTRWSITAVDDTIGKNIIDEIEQYQQGDLQIFFGGAWGNYYLVLMFADAFRYELFEMYLKLDVNPWSKQGYKYSTDYESYGGRTAYAEETAGGYYAARLPVLEKMKEMKRQCSALVLRFITDEYNVPLGVWVCREAARKSLYSPGIIFASREEMFVYARALVQDKFKFNLDIVLEKSKLLHEGKQKRLGEF